MENKVKCKIVQDLLPNYIDKLTSEETNSFVEKHLEECTECTEIIENMKKNFEKGKNEVTQKTIKYAKKYKQKVKHLWLIILLFVFLFISIIAIFWPHILWLIFEKKYEIKHNNRYLIEETLSYDKENNLIEENSTHVNDFNVVLSDLEYTENKLNFNLKFSHSEPLNNTGYILRVFNEDYFLGERFNGQLSFDSALEWLISTDTFYKENFNFTDISRNTSIRLTHAPENNYNLLNVTKYQKQDELLEDGSLLHKISFEIPKEFIIDDTLNIVLFDINYQNIGNKTYYQLKEPLSEIKYTIDFKAPFSLQNDI